MVGELVMLPVRVGVRVTRLWFRAVEETVSITTTATGRVFELMSSRSSGEAGVADAAAGVADAPHPSASTMAPGSPSEAPAERDDETDRRAGRGRTGGEGAREPSQPPTEVRGKPPTEVRDFAPPVAQPAPSPPRSAEPAHVSEEPELVEEFAEPGAEEGAGAEVHVDPPWDGYDRMNAKQVISRLASAGSVELAAVELYESSHRRRQTILNAVDRELRHPNGSGSSTQERG